MVGKINMDYFNPYDRKNCISLIEGLKLTNLTSSQNNDLSRHLESAMLGILYAKGFSIKDIPVKGRDEE